MLLAIAALQTACLVTPNTAARATLHRTIKHPCGCINFDAHRELRMAGADRPFRPVVADRQRAAKPHDRMNSRHDALRMSMGGTQQQTPSQRARSGSAPHDWIAYGLSWVFLAHFASLYTQIPGLYGASGLTPITLASARDAIDDTWLLGLLPLELGMECFCAAGILIAGLQVAISAARRGLGGMLCYSLLLVLWHDLLYGGGRFMAYQMDALLLDATPMAVLAASGLAPAAATFGYRWLLTRLYIGAGAVKLLSCDASWRDLSAVHWHLQSQPLPNPLASVAFSSLPEAATSAATLAVLVIELAIPYLFLAPSPTLRRLAFTAHVGLMAAIALFGNFGPLQIVLAILGLALLDEDDLPASVPGVPPPGEAVTQLTPPGEAVTQLTPPGEAVTSLTPPREFASPRTAPRTAATDAVRTSSAPDEQEVGAPSLVVNAALSATAVALAAAGTAWVVHDVTTSCAESWSADLLVYSALGYAAASLLASSLAPSAARPADVSVGLLLLAGSTVPFAQGLDVSYPLAFGFLDALNIGAQPYGLFATMTGVGGRPVEVLEAAYAADGPWQLVPLRYQVNDLATPPPLCVPHFPRMDWTLWFVPLGEGGRWVGRLAYGITHGDPAILHLLDDAAFDETFADGPPEYVRLALRTYGFGEGGNADAWALLADEGRTEVLQRDAMARFGPLRDDATWPSLPGLRAAADACGGGERFVWACCALAESVRRTRPQTGRLGELASLNVPDSIRRWRERRV